jgi:hypothetical protein
MNLETQKRQDLGAHLAGHEAVRATCFVCRPITPGQHFAALIIGAFHFGEVA